MRILFPNPNTPIPHLQHVVLIYQKMATYTRWEKLWLGKPFEGYMDMSALPWWKKVLLIPSLGQYYRANPRSLEYMLKTAAEILPYMSPDVTFDLIVCSDEPIPPESQKLAQVIWHHQDASQALTRCLQDKSYQGVVLLFTDPIGRGWGALEKKICQSAEMPIYVLNGRKRLMIWDRQAQQQLNLHRTLAWLFLGEASMLLLLGIVALPLGIYDQVRRLLGGHNHDF